jgi:four helix bundle protein
MGDFHRLAVWKKSHQLTLRIYAASGSFPRGEQYSLTSQLRRAASSIPANIAEGCGRDTDPELARYCGIALGSASELEYHLLLSRDLTYLADDLYQELTREVDEVKRMLASLITRIRSHRPLLTADD